MKVAVAGLVICGLIAAFLIIGIRIYNHEKAIEWRREHGYGDNASSDDHCLGAWWEAH